MEGRLILDVLSRFLHVGTAIVLVGGTIFMRFVLMPAADKLAPDVHESLRASILRVWKIFVSAGVALLLITGLYNYLVVTMPAHRGDSTYHMLMGIKILLALVVFFLASVLVGRARAFESLRQNRKTWLAVIILLAAVIVAISSYLKVRPHEPAASATAHSFSRDVQRSATVSPVALAPGDARGANATPLAKTRGANATPLAQRMRSAARRG